MCICGLKDEVESLTAARTAALNGTEPGDAVRVCLPLITIHVINSLLAAIENAQHFSTVSKHMSHKNRLSMLFSLNLIS